MRNFARSTVAISLLTASAMLVPVVSLPTAQASRPDTSTRTQQVALESGRDDAAGAPAQEVQDHAHDHGGDGHHEVTEADLAFASAPIEAEDAVLLGARWSGEAIVEVRTETAGSWNPWTRLHRDAEEHIPDEDSEERTALDDRVSEPIWTGEVDRVQFRSTGARELTAMYVDSSGGLAWSPNTAGPAATAHAAPKILRRSDWGADESLRDGRVTYSSDGTIRFSVVHHEGGTPSWTAAEIRDGCRKADDKINAIYEYHTQHRGYWDIGYNFVVDPCGRIWEARAGGIDRPVNGAHAGGFNDGSVGVLALGTFSGDSPDPVTKRMINGIESIVGYKLDRYLVDPGGSTRETSGGGTTARWPSGTSVTLPVLSAHQISNQTSCPGWRLMGSLFTGSNTSASPRQSYIDGVRAEAPYVATMTDSDNITTVGDWTGNGRTEILFYARSTGHTTVFRLRDNGTLGPALNRYQLAPGWNHIIAGDWNGDGNDELTFIRNSSGAFATYEGASDGWIGRRKTLRHLNYSWNNVTAGDWNGNGRDQLTLHRTSDGRYSSYTMTLSGDLNTLTTHRRLRYAWDKFVGGDWDGNGRDQLTLHRKSDGRFSSYTMSRRGDLASLDAHTRLNVPWRWMHAHHRSGSSADAYLLYTSTGRSARISSYTATRSGSLDQNLSIQFIPE